MSFTRFLKFQITLLILLIEKLFLTGVMLNQHEPFVSDEQLCKENCWFSEQPFEEDKKGKICDSQVMTEKF